MYETLNSARSAISLLASEDLSRNIYLSRFLKGVFKLRPSRPKYDATWDTDPVLDKLSQLYPLGSLNLQSPTSKAILLLALGTAHRCQTFSLITTDNIHVLSSGVEIRIHNNIKTSRPGALQPLLILPFFNDKPELCAARTIIIYLEVTSVLRKSEKRLFLSKASRGSICTNTGEMDQDDVIQIWSRREIHWA